MLANPPNSNFPRIFFVSLVAFNPMIVAMSTRGSNDNIISLLVVTCVYLVLKRRYIWGGFFLGLSIHFKIYPIIYSFVLYFFIDCDRALIAQGGSPLRAIVSKKGFFTKNRLIFTCMTIITLLSLTAVFYKMYGYEFLWEAYLYHFGRKDHRHNNSVYWYYIYQLFDVQTSSSTLAFLTFLPQWAVLITAGILFYYDLFTAMLIQTWAFVAFNKVQTAQYFLWWLVLLPICLVNSDLIQSKLGLFICLALSWAVGQCIWGYYANAFENQQQATHLEIFYSTVLWFVLNFGCCLIVLRNQYLHLQLEFPPK